MRVAAAFCPAPPSPAQTLLQLKKSHCFGIRRRRYCIAPASSALPPAISRSRFPPVTHKRFDHEQRKRKSQRPLKSFEIPLLQLRLGLAAFELSDSLLVNRLHP